MNKYYSKSYTDLEKTAKENASEYLKDKYKDINNNQSNMNASLEDSYGEPLGFTCIYAGGWGGWLGSPYDEMNSDIEESYEKVIEKENPDFKKLKDTAWDCINSGNISKLKYGQSTFKFNGVSGIITFNHDEGHRIYMPTDWVIKNLDKFKMENYKNFIIGKSNIFNFSERIKNLTNFSDKFPTSLHEYHFYGFFTPVSEVLKIAKKNEDEEFIDIEKLAEKELKTPEKDLFYLSEDSGTHENRKFRSSTNRNRGINDVLSKISNNSKQLLYDSDLIKTELGNIIHKNSDGYDYYIMSKEVAIELGYKIAHKIITYFDHGSY